MEIFPVGFQCHFHFLFRLTLDFLLMDLEVEGPSPIHPDQLAYLGGISSLSAPKLLTALAGRDLADLADRMWAERMRSPSSPNLEHIGHCHWISFPVVFLQFPLVLLLQYRKNLCE